MKVHELIGSMPREQRGPSLTESKAVPAGEAGRAILAEAMSKTYQPSAEPQPQARKLRLKEFLLMTSKLDGRAPSTSAASTVKALPTTD